MPRNKVFFPPSTCPRSAGIHFTNLCCWLGVSSSASAFKPILNNGNIATESSVCWLRPIVHREWLSGRDGWACKRKCASNVDCYEVMGLGAIDQSEKSILNGKIMQHAAKGKDLGTILKSCNPSLGMQLNKGEKNENKSVLGDRRQKCIQRVEYKSCKDAAVLQANSWTLRWAVPICHWLREEPLAAAAASRQDSTKGGTLEAPPQISPAQAQHTCPLIQQRSFTFSSQFFQHLKQSGFHPKLRK